MSFVNKTKRIIIALLLSAFTAAIFCAFSQSANASFGGDVGDFIGDLFDMGEQGLSFTEYEGQLAQLSPEGYNVALTASTNLREFVVKIVNFALGFLGLIAVIIVIYGGVLYVIAAGEEEKTQTGKKAITYAVIGLLIVLGSFAFVNTVIKGATGDTDTTGGALSTLGTTGGGFNASSEQIRSLAVEIYNGFAFLDESTEELKNIKNDAEKESLIPSNFPAKTDILNFLHSVERKLDNMKSKMQPFSVTEAKINELLRELNKEIDKIDRLERKNYLKLSGTVIEECDVDEERSFTEGLLQDSDEEICGDAGYNIYYTVDLYEIWEPLQEKYTSSSSSEEATDLYDLITPISNDYAVKLKEIFLKLDTIISGFLNIEVISKGRTISAYSALKSSNAFGFGVNNGQITIVSDGVLSDVDRWTLDSDTASTGQKLLNGLEKMAIVYEELKALKFVQARLTADTIEGSAPLPVIFDILGSVDPAGGSIQGGKQGGNITWDLAGTLTTSEFIEAPAGQTIEPIDDSVNCAFTVEHGEETDFIGNTSKRCIYDKPGTYTAAVKINSNEPTKYAPGISILTIKVHPPTTKIELKIEAGGRTQTIMHYINDILASDLREVTVTASDAEDGILYDASETAAAQFKWTFGDGEISEYQSSGTVEHSYEEPGKYEIMLEVINELGVQDKKIFTLKIASIAARLKVEPQNRTFINTPVVFDASDSKSDLGQIVNYEWTIEPSPGQLELANLPEPVSPITESGRGLKTLTHEFGYPINYDITVEVTDDSSNKDSFTISNYRVESHPPVALFTHEIPLQSQPGTIYFDATDSYDPDGTENFEYEWKIEPLTGWEVIDQTKNGLDTIKPIVKFKEKGNYDVTLKITDKIAANEFSEVKETVNVDNILDIAWADDQGITFILDENGKVEVGFELLSETAVAYEIDFGDGQTDSGTFGEEITHVYTEGGQFTIKATVYDDSDNDNSVQRRIFISGGDEPIADIALSVNEVEIQDLSRPIIVTKKSVLKFDASRSKNIDGTGRNLKYSWNFGDGRNNSDKTVEHTYKELSPRDPGYFVVKLIISDANDASLRNENEIYIDVINIPPRFSSVQGIVQSVSSDLVTPVMLNMKVYGAFDPDGEIVSYKWWYFDIIDPSERLGVQVTPTESAQLMIGTRGKQGVEKTYGFGLELTDSDGLKYDNEEAIQNDQFASITVKNGPNELPTAKFNVDSTYVYAGDTVNFTSSSSDPDGSIIQYIWDTEGDGFFNDDPTNKSSIQHIYTSKNKEGYDVRLKIIDDKGGEAVSEPIKVYVDSLAVPPTAAFKYEVIDGSRGMKIKFTNNSKADENAGAKIINYKWDFDTDSVLSTADSDGDGMKDNDTDSSTSNPERLFMSKGVYNVKLTVTDDQGNTDEVTNGMIVPLAGPPIAAFTYEIVDGQVIFHNNSTANIESNAQIKEYVWDFDTVSNLITADSNGDSIKDNDQDSTIAEPVHNYPQNGLYTVKLTVIDNFENSAEVTHDINFTTGGGQVQEGENQEEVELSAVLIASPAPDGSGVIHLNGETGTVQFDFSKSVGPIAYYIIDKNIYFDTNGNTVKNDDEDFKTSLPGRWRTNFDKEWGRIVSKLTVVDIHGNENSTNLEITFE